MKNNYISRRSFLKLAGISGFSLLVPRAIKNRTYSAPIPQLSPQKTNIIILVLDTLSARHMSLHGYDRNTTPNLSKFAEKSTVFQRHYAAGNFTIPNTASLLSGTYPWSHRGINLYGSVQESFASKNIFREFNNNNFKSYTYTHNTQTSYILNQYKLDIQEIVPIEDLVIFDWNTLAAGFKNDYPRGFDAIQRWKNVGETRGNSLFLGQLVTMVNYLKTSRLFSKNKEFYPDGMSINQEGYVFKLEDSIDWIAQKIKSTQAPFLGYFHLLPPHEPYTPRAEFFDKFANDDFQSIDKPTDFFTDKSSKGELANFQQRYDEYIAFADAEIGRLLDYLERKNSLESTYVVITSDHGQLFERGIHGHLTPVLYEPLIHIPLIIHSPGQNQRKDIFSPTSIIDIMPTCLNLSGQDIPSWCEGELLPSLGGEENFERPIFAIEAKGNSKFSPIIKGTLSIIRWPYKLINYRGYPGHEDVDELYDLENDPEELHNLASDLPELTSNLKHELDYNLVEAENKSIKTS